MSTLIGIDGCPGGWLAIIHNTITNSTSAQIFSHIGEIKMLPDVSVVTIDIPIGLSDIGARDCDTLARHTIKPRHCSVFPAPLRPMLAAADYQECCSIGRTIRGKAISKQTFAIMDKIREVDDFLIAHPEWQTRFYEIHPELAFTSMSGAPMPSPKKSITGQLEREVILAEHFGPHFKMVAKGLAKTFAHDDLYDAYVALWIAQRIARGEAKSLPESPPIDSAGLPMRMMY